MEKQIDSIENEIEKNEKLNSKTVEVGYVARRKRTLVRAL